MHHLSSHIGHCLRGAGKPVENESVFVGAPVTTPHGPGRVAAFKSRNGLDHGFVLNLRGPNTVAVVLDADSSAHVYRTSYACAHASTLKRDNT